MSIPQRRNLTGDEFVKLLCATGEGTPSEGESNGKHKESPGLPQEEERPDINQPENQREYKLRIPPEWFGFNDEQIRDAILNGMRVENIPLELREIPRWVCWVWVEVKDDKPKKEPRHPGGWYRLDYHKVIEAESGGAFTFDAALQALREHEDGAGLWFVQPGGGGIVTFDLDRCRNPETGVIDGWAAEIIARFNSYTEVSPSGEGVRVIIKGTWPETQPKRSLPKTVGAGEVKGEGYISLTGRKLDTHGAGQRIEDRGEELVKWHKEVFRKQGKGRVAKTPTTSPPARSDSPTTSPAGREPNSFQALEFRRLALLCGGSNDAARIFAGEWSLLPFLEGKSQSEADHVLAKLAIRAEWSDDEIVPLLIQARENARATDHADPDDYYGRTIAKAREEVEADDHGDLAGTWEDVEKQVSGTRWLLKGWIPRGMLTGLIAEPKLGKSGFVLGGVVKPIVTGCQWFDGSPGPDPGYVIWCDTEMSNALNIDRGKAMGIPFDRIIVPYRKDPTRPLSLDNDEDVQRIRHVIDQYNPRLLVVDAFRGAHGGNENDSRISGVLRKLANIAEQTGIAVILVHHTKKMGDGEKLTPNSGRGSNAFLAYVRCQLTIDRPDPKSQWRRVQVLGENLGINPGPVGFRFTAGGTVEFGPAPTPPRKATKQGDAAGWLRMYMEPGKWYPSAKIEVAANRFGFSGTALQNAKELIGMIKPLYVQKRKNIKTGKVEWLCRLPPPE